MNCMYCTQPITDPADHRAVRSRSGAVQTARIACPHCEPGKFYRIIPSRCHTCHREYCGKCGLVATGDPSEHVGVCTCA